MSVFSRREGKIDWGGGGLNVWHAKDFLFGGGGRMPLIDYTHFVGTLYWEICTTLAAKNDVHTLEGNLLS